MKLKIRRSFWAKKHFFVVVKVETGKVLVALQKVSHYMGKNNNNNNNRWKCHTLRNINRRSARVHSL